MSLNCARVHFVVPDGRSGSAPSRAQARVRGDDWNINSVSAAIARGKRPVTFRTRKLRLSAPMVLRGGPRGRVGHRRTSSARGGGHPHTVRAGLPLFLFVHISEPVSRWDTGFPCFCTIRRARAACPLRPRSSERRLQQLHRVRAVVPSCLRALSVACSARAARRRRDEPGIDVGPLSAASLSSRAARSELHDRSVETCRRPRRERDVLAAQNRSCGLGDEPAALQVAPAASCRRLRRSGGLQLSSGRRPGPAPSPCRPGECRSLRDRSAPDCAS